MATMYQYLVVGLRKEGRIRIRPQGYLNRQYPLLELRSGLLALCPADSRLCMPWGCNELRGLVKLGTDPMAVGGMEDIVSESGSKETSL